MAERWSLAQYQRAAAVPLGLAASVVNAVRVAPPLLCGFGGDHDKKKSSSGSYSASVCGVEMSARPPAVVISVWLPRRRRRRRRRALLAAARREEVAAPRRLGRCLGMTRACSLGARWRRFLASTSEGDDSRWCSCCRGRSDGRCSAVGRRRRCCRCCRC